MRHDHRAWRAIATAAGVAAGATIAPAAQAACSAPQPDGATSVVTCGFAGREQAFTVPPAVDTLQVFAVGAGGGRGSAGQGLGSPGFGNPGAFASGPVRVAPGRALYVLVGGIGGSRALQGGAGGFNGGGQGGTEVNPTPRLVLDRTAGGAGGGGATDLRTCSTSDRSCDTLASRLIVGGGGGGGGGGPATGGFFDIFAAPGSPGTTAAGGAGGGPAAGSGGAGTGGGGANSVLPLAAGGGGGGGRFGGGGGAGATTSNLSGGSGGAGASFGPSGTVFGPSSGPRAFVRITYATPRTIDVRPAVRIVRPRAGTKVSGRGRLVVSGTASDPSGVRGVALRIERMPRRTSGSSRCTWLDPVAGLRRASCQAPPSPLATLRSNGSWSYAVSRRVALPAARYRVTAYGTDETGIYGNSAPAAARSVTFGIAR